MAEREIKVGDCVWFYKAGKRVSGIVMHLSKRTAMTDAGNVKIRNIEGMEAARG